MKQQEHPLCSVDAHVITEEHCSMGVFLGQFCTAFFEILLWGLEHTARPFS